MSSEAIAELDRMMDAIKPLAEQRHGIGLQILALRDEFKSRHGITEQFLRDWIKQREKEREEATVSKMEKVEAGDGGHNDC